MKIKTVVATVVGMLVANVAFAEEAATQAAEAVVGAANGDMTKAALAIAAAFAIAIAALGGTLGQSKAAVAALEGIARNPGAASKVQTPMIIALALIESLVIYALVIAFMLQGKI